MAECLIHTMVVLVVNSGPRVEVSDEPSVAEYMAGYEYNERYGDKKDYR